jgi:hypothetical protein
MRKLPWQTRETEQGVDDPFFGFLYGNTALVPELVGLKIQDPNAQAEQLSDAFTSKYIYPRPRSQSPGLVGSVVYCRTCAAAVEDMFAVAGHSPSAQKMAELRRKILGFAQLRPNWDGEDGEELSPETIATALKIVEHIAIVLGRKNTCAAPSVRPFPDGSVFFKWIQGQRELTLTVLGRSIEAQRWEPLDAYHSQGLWEISVDETPEHIEWVLT